MRLKPSLTWRIGIGKLVGLLIGAAGYLSLPWLTGESDHLLQWAVLLWYATLGAIIGVFGVYNWHPILSLPLPWWLRAPLIGGWMNFVLLLFTYERMQSLMASMFGSGSPLSSPAWLVVEGAVIGAFIGWITTSLAGEGPSTIER